MRKLTFLGRCTDSALALAPLMHEFGWKSTDLDKANMIIDYF